MKKTMKFMAVLMSMLFVVLSFAGCGESKTSNSSDSNSDNAKSEKLGMVLSTLDNPFFVTMKDGAEKKAKELGVDLVVLNSNNDATKERSNVEDLIQQGISVLIINPTDSDAVATTVKFANEKKIPVITVDRVANGGDVVCHIASDNVAGGKMAGEFLLEKIGGSGNVVELQGIPGASATRDRGKGFHEAIDGKDGVKVIASQSADFDRQKGLTVMENIIQSNPDFKGVFAHNDEMALGALKALKAANKKDVVIVGFDGGDDAVNAVNSGDMAATIAQQPDLMGSLSVENADKLAKGQTIDKTIPVELKLIKK